MAGTSSWSPSDSVASRVRRNPRAASREARNRLTALFSVVEQRMPVNRSQRCERSTPLNSRYFLRSMRR
jgi:hypothetical protein